MFIFFKVSYIYGLLLTLFPFVWGGSTTCKRAFFVGLKAATPNPKGWQRAGMPIFLRLNLLAAILLTTYHASVPITKGGETVSPLNDN